MRSAEYFLHYAIQLALTHSADGHHGPFGAVVVNSQGEIIGEGWNQVVHTCDPTAHAEIVAIRHACQTIQSHQLRGCTLYSSCEPCPMCFGAILWSRVSSLVYSASREEATQAGFDDSPFWNIIQNQASHPSEFLTVTHFPLPQRLDPFLAWIKNPYRIGY